MTGKLAFKLEDALDFPVARDYPARSQRDGVRGQ